MTGTQQRVTSPYHLQANKKKLKYNFKKLRQNLVPILYLPRKFPFLSKVMYLKYFLLLFN